MIYIAYRKKEGQELHLEKEERNGVKDCLISVVVPIYNTEKYLAFCIDSIINQTYRNIEIILVDDGSTDGSLNICKDYAKSDSRITIIKGKHRGLVSARKLGVNKAKGLYCIFVDSDDWIDLNLVEATLAQTGRGTVDIVNYNLYSVCNGKKNKWEYSFTDGVYEGSGLENIYTRMMFDFYKNKPGIIQSLCSKLIKRSLLSETIQQEDERITYGEDAAAVYIAMLKAKKIAIMNQYVYYYRVHSESMMHKKDISIFKDVYVFHNYMKKRFSEYKGKYYLREQLQAYIMFFLRPALNDCFSLNIQELYDLPLRLQNRKTKVILYGAGHIGKSYYMQLSQLHQGQIEIVAWVDKKLQNQMVYGYRIDSPEVIDRIECDKIILAVKNEITAEEIKRELSGLNLDMDMVWIKPVERGRAIYIDNAHFFE